MSSRVILPSSAPATSAPSPARTVLLQRKCACGARTPSLGGECAECTSKKNRLQAKLAIGSRNDPLEQEADRVADRLMGASTSPALGSHPPQIQLGQHVVFGTGRFRPATREGRWLLAHELTHVVQQSHAFESSDKAPPHGARLPGASPMAVVSKFSSPLKLAKFEPSPQYMPPPMTRPAPGVMPSPGTLAPETAPRYATEPTTDFYEMYERAKQAPDCDSAQLELEIPVATLARGGQPPDFVTDGAKQKSSVQLNDTCHITFTPRALHILNAIEYGVERATGNTHLKAVLDKYIDDRKPVDECKCGYESIQNVNSDDPRKRARAEQKLIAILRQKDNHLRVAQACGLSVTYKVSSDFLAQTLRSAWSDVAVEHARIVGFPTDSCAP